MPFLTRPNFEDRQQVQYSGTSISLSGITNIDLSGKIKIKSGAVPGLVAKSLDFDGTVVWEPISGLTWSLSACTSPFYTSNIIACPSSAGTIVITAGYVGVGNNSPMALLDVGGDALINGLTIGQGSGVADDNTAIGYQSLLSNTIGIYNVGVGIDTLFLNVDGSWNTAVGGGALTSNVDGNSNTAVGSGSLNFNISGYQNTSQGYASLLSNTIGYNNTASGYSSLNSNTIGNSNTAIGSLSLYNNVGGNKNVAIGSYSLQSNISGSYNTAIGYGTDVSGTTLTGATAIGDGAVVAVNDGLVLGKNGTKVGINTSSPQATFDLYSYDGRSRFYYDDKIVYPYENVEEIFINGTNDLIVAIGATVDSGRIGVGMGAIGLTNTDPYPVNVNNGTTGDTFIASTTKAHSLNILNFPSTGGAPGSGVDDHIRFYAGSYASQANADIHIQGAGSTRGYIGVGINSPTAKLDISGTTGYNQFRMRKSYTPTSTADTNGNVGDIAWDNSYLYIKTNTGWGRTLLDYAF